MRALMSGAVSAGDARKAIGGMDGASMGFHRHYTVCRPKFAAKVQFDSGANCERGGASEELDIAIVFAYQWKRRNGSGELSRR